jgi:hypothetical protein
MLAGEMSVDEISRFLVSSRGIIVRYVCQLGCLERLLTPGESYLSPCLCLHANAAAHVVMPRGKIQYQVHTRPRWREQ